MENLEELYQNEKILLVDDDENLLSGLKRQFYKVFSFDTAVGGYNALLKIKDSPQPYSVIISDMRMPEMNGIEFLKKAKAVSPDSVRIMLTGNADMETAIDAVNKGNIFRFLSKPIEPQSLKITIIAAIRQYKLVVAERDILEKTLNESIRVLVEVMSLVNSLAFHRSSRIKSYTNFIVSQLKTINSWQYEAAALLSQIGYITIPQEILLKVYNNQDLTPEEQIIYSNYPEAGARIISNIPRLEGVAYMIRNQRKNFSEFTVSNELTLGAQILKAVSDFDMMRIFGDDIKHAVYKLKKPEIYNSEIIEIMEEIGKVKLETIYKSVKLEELNTSMILDQDIVAKNGMLLARKDQQVSSAMVELFLAYSKNIGVPELILIKQES